MITGIRAIAVQHQIGSVVILIRRFQLGRIVIGSDLRQEIHVDALTVRILHLNGAFVLIVSDIPDIGQVFFLDVITVENEDLVAVVIDQQWLGVRTDQIVDFLIVPIIDIAFVDQIGHDARAVLDEDEIRAFGTGGDFLRNLSDLVCIADLRAFKFNV